jgi:HlyD family secretion protein
VQGQAIAKGDTLMVLSSKLLLQEIEKLYNKIKVLESERIEKQGLLKSEISLLQSTHAVSISELEQEITQAQSELNLNKSLSSSLKTNTSPVAASPLEEKIKSLKAEIDLRNKSLQVQINDLTVKHSTDQSILQNQIRLLQEELAFMQREKSGLIKIAPGDGVVESIPVKQGEEISSYASLLTILPKNPTSVIGYLQAEKGVPAIGSKVQLTGYESRWNSIEGTVIGYGAITALPEILQKSTAVKAFGKEIFIEIPAQNTFSTGEKMLIRL